MKELVQANSTSHVLTQPQLVDRFGRRHDYVRLSVTDKCSLRCVYCMPEEGLTFFPDDRILTASEIIQLVTHFAQLGVTKIRLTGGEPLLRSDLLEIIAGIAHIQEIQDIALTTNGLALARLAKPLYAAGLNRLNISLDSFDADKYREITRGGSIRQLLKGIEAAARQPFEAIKLNVVVIKGQNDNELADFLRYSMKYPVNIRFIEFMPIGHNKNVRDRALWKTHYQSLDDMIFDVIRAQGWDYAPIHFRGNGPSENYQIIDAKGSFGLIHPVSCQFCETCNRLRITADGCLKSCLYWDDEVNIRESIPDFDAFSAKVRQALGSKPQNHEMALAENEKSAFKKPTWRHMSQIGG